MKWYKHDADASLDSKMQEILLDYGLEGYGLYWYCLELITAKINTENITFELEHDARIIARNTGSTVQKVQEMMKRFVELGLFESSQGKITCFKLAKRLNKSMGGSPQFRKMIDKIQNSHDFNSNSHDSVMPESRKVIPEQNRTEQKEALSGKPDDPARVLDYLNLKVGRNFQHVPSNLKPITARLKEGRTVEEIKLVIDDRFKAWGGDEKMREYLRPATLFNASKFNSYFGNLGDGHVETVGGVDMRNIL